MTVLTIDNVFEEHVVDLLYDRAIELFNEGEGFRLWQGYDSNAPVHSCFLIKLLEENDPAYNTIKQKAEELTGVTSYSRINCAFHYVPTGLSISEHEDTVHSRQVKACCTIHLSNWKVGWGGDFGYIEQGNPQQIMFKKNRAVVMNDDTVHWVDRTRHDAPLRVTIQVFIYD